MDSLPMSLYRNQFNVLNEETLPPLDTLQTYLDVLKRMITSQ